MTDSINYIQNGLNELIVDLDSIIDSDEYSETTNDEFRKTIKISKELSILIKEIDKLIQGEQDEESFYSNILDDIEELDFSEINELDF